MRLGQTAAGLLATIAAAPAAAAATQTQQADSQHGAQLTYQNVATPHRSSPVINGHGLDLTQNRPDRVCAHRAFLMLSARFLSLLRRRLPIRHRQTKERLWAGTNWSVK
jgi:hypothetical protein